MSELGVAGAENDVGLDLDPQLLGQRGPHVDLGERAETLGRKRLLDPAHGVVIGQVDGDGLGVGRAHQSSLVVGRPDAFQALIPPMVLNTSQPSRASRLAATEDR